MQYDDLPLFAFKPPCKLIPFPAARRVGKIAHVAAKIHERRGKEKAINHYWSQVVEAMAAQLEKAGFDNPTIIAEIDAFEEAVHAEVRRLRAIDQYRHGGR
jgi:hypothetical protein